MKTGETSGNNQLNTPATFSLQETLQYLPIPALDSTCEKLLAWNSVILSEDELAHSREVVNEFQKEGGTGQKLQQRLEQWSQEKDVKNWLEEFWNESYLAYRKPLCVNSNVFYLLDNIPELDGLTLTQVATSLIEAVLHFKELIDSETLAVDMERDQPLCMIQYKKLFTTTRIPQQGCDIRKSPNCEHYPNPTNSRHVVVFYKGQPVVVDVLGDDARPLAHDVINQTLMNVIAHIDMQEPARPVGLFTTLDRESWALARQNLLEAGDDNETVINTIETALFVVCLDTTTPQNLTETARTMMHSNGKNRWFDKSMQLIVCPNGLYGVTAEHSGLDGSVIGKMFKMVTGSKFDHGWQNTTTETCSFQELKFQMTEELDEMLQNAETEFDKLVANTRVKVLAFEDFGKERMKSLKVSPDAYVQLAMQRAQHRFFGKCYNVYEPVMTRQFLHGRTEAARTVTPESVAFVEAMAANDCDDKTRAELLQKAAKAHVSRLVEAKSGQGVQRHLMGLLKMYQRYSKELGIDERPQLYSDPVWTRMCHDTFSTSTSDPVGIALAGYGPVVDDGFGIRYVTKKDAVFFTMSSRETNGDTLDVLYKYVHEAMLEMERVLSTAMVA